MSNTKMTNNVFELSTDDVLGFTYESFIQSIGLTYESLAISSPQKYYDMRAEVLKKVKRDAVSNFYKTIFILLTEGKDLAGNPIIRNQYGAPLIVEYPSQKTNTFAISAASEMNQWCEKALDIVLPDFEKIASQKMVLKGLGDVVE